MGKILKNHTCSYPIWCDGEINLKGHGFKFLEKDTLDMYPSFCLPIVGNSSTYDVNTGWERIMSLKIYNILKTRNKLWFFLVERCGINFHTLEKSPKYHTIHIDWVYMSDGVGIKLNYIQNHTMFIFTTKHYIDKLRPKNSSAAMYWHY